VGRVPLFHQTLLQQQLASEQLLVEATIEGQFAKADVVRGGVGCRKPCFTAVFFHTPLELFYGSARRFAISTSS
jgi:hypothetical protein